MSAGIDPSQSDLAHARHYVLGRLGLAGPLLAAPDMAGMAQELGMIQIDSIRVNGLRNHELAWVARGEAPIAAYYDLLYARRAFVETHYPLFAIKRDWLSWFQQDFSKVISRTDTLRELRPLMRKVKRRIRDQGPVSPADFDSDRVPGGFNTVKATTKALEYLYYLGDVQIAGRTQHFHRLFDLTERVAPELLSAKRRSKSELAEFCVRSAMSVFKLASRDELARRAAHHLGTWRGGLPAARKAVDRALTLGQIVEVDFLRAKSGEAYLTLPEDLRRPLPAFDETMRIVPPLDNLLFCRTRLKSLFGLDFKFEAYTPKRHRRFYFAMPIIYRGAIVGLLDAKKDENVWRVNALELFADVPADELRAAIQRLGAIAGVARIACSAKVPIPWRKILSGPIAR